MHQDMPVLIRVLFGAWVLAPFGCAQRTSSGAVPTSSLTTVYARPSARPSAAESHRDGPGAPAWADWTNSSFTETRAQLHAVIRHVAELGYPLTVRVQTPPNTRLVRGPAEIQLPMQLTEHILDLELEYERLPTEDLIVVAEGHSASAGVHVELPFRFGRPEPTAPSLPLGPATIVNGRNLGRPILMNP